MGELATLAHERFIEIGEMSILVRTDSLDFAHLLEDRYGSFVSAPVPRPAFELDIELAPLGSLSEDEDVDVRRESGCWLIQRGDFRAELNPKTCRGWVRQTENPYSIDAVLRILHSLILAEQGGFLVHAASAVRNGWAYVFAGVSGAGKTTLARLAPPDVRLLTDEISYVRPRDSGYEAFGTPFAGELARLGENLRAPLAALHLLEQGPENRLEEVSEAEAAQALLRNILFFAHDEELVGMIFQTVCDFVRRVPVRRLVFTPDARVWELIA